MLTVVSEMTSMLSAEEAQVVLEGDNFDELSSKEAKDAAIRIGCAMGLGQCAISNISGAYIPMADGSPITTNQDLKTYRQMELLDEPQPRPRNEFVLHVVQTRI